MERTADYIAEQARLQRSRVIALIHARAPYEEQTAAAKEYIRLNYEWQAARFGAVRQKYSVRYLLRALS